MRLILTIIFAAMFVAIAVAGVMLDPALVAACVYTGYTLAMMALFGVEEWCETGEIFSVYFGMFSQLGFFGVRDGRFGRRRPLAAATPWAAIPGSAAVVVASIASTSFDGAQEGAFKGAIEKVFDWIGDIGFGPTAGLRLSDTIFMLLCFAGVGAGLRARRPRHARRSPARPPWPACGPPSPTP